MVIEKLEYFLKESISTYPFDKFTIHDTIKGLLISYFLCTEYYFIPEVSKYKRVGDKSIKKRIDGIVIDNNDSPFLAIEIDREFKKRNYDTLLMWPTCFKIWIDYSFDCSLKLPDNREDHDQIHIIHLFKVLTCYKKFEKKFLRKL